MSDAVQFTATKEEFQYIRQIADRACSAGFYSSVQDALMDIEAVHSNGCSLDLQALAHSAPLHFNHDIGGIRRHLDRTTGRLGDHFTPRHARPRT